MYVLKSPVSTNDTTKPFIYRDELVNGDSGGVKLLFDFGFGWSYPAGDLPRSALQNPSDGDLVRDVSHNLNNGNAVVPAGVTMTHSNGGIKTTTTTQFATFYSANDVDGVLDDFTKSTEYIVCFYAKLASLADFRPNGESISAFVSAANFGKSYANSTELVLIASSPKDAGNTSGGLTARFQTAVGTVTRLDINLPSGNNLYDSDIVQVAAYVKDGYCHFRIKGSVFEQSASSAFTGNTVSVAAQSIGFDTSRGQFGSTSVPHRLYRGFVENLTVSGRDPITVLNADYHRVVARGVFS